MVRKKPPASPDQDTDPIPDFEAALAALEGLVEEMERGEQSLEQSLAAYEQGVRLTRRCQQALRQAELRVEQLRAEAELPEPFHPAVDTADGHGDD